MSSNSNTLNKKQISKEDTLQKNIGFNQNIELISEETKLEPNSSSNYQYINNDGEKSTEDKNIKNDETKKYSFVDCTIESSNRIKLLDKFKPTNKDLSLKLLGKMVYETKGYHCELECKLFESSYYERYRKEQLSDLDIYGVKFEEDLKCHKVGYECKSSSTNGIDEVLKIKGIQALTDLDYVGLLKKNVSNNVRVVASKINVHVNDETEIKCIVEAIVPDYKNKLKDEFNLYCLQNSIEIEIKPVLKGCINFIRGLYWTNRPYENIHTIIRLFEHLNSKDLQGYQYKYIVLKLSVLLSICFLEISSQIISSDFGNVNDAAIDHLFGGATQRWEKSRTYDLLSQELGKKLSPYPYYYKDYINIINWLTLDMKNSSKVVLCITDYLNCFLLGNNIEDTILPYGDNSLKLSKDVLRFVARIIKSDDLFIDIYKI